MKLLGGLLAALVVLVALPGAVRAQSEWSAIVGGEYFAQQPQDAPAPPSALNGLWKATDGVMAPLGEGVFTSGTVSRMVRNASSIIIGGTFHWTRCDPRSCAQGSGFADRSLMRNLAIFDFDTGQWSGVGHGCAGQVYDLLVTGSSLFVGGSIGLCYNEPGVGPAVVLVNNIVAWNAQTGWRDLGGQFFNVQVTSLARDPQSERIFAVGKSKSDYAGAPFLFLQVFDGENWNPLLQITQSVNDNAFNVVRCIDGWVYVGGVFTTFNIERFTQNIIRFPADDVFNIDPMNGGVSGAVNDIVAYRGGVLVGGSFATAGEPEPVSVNHLGYFVQGKWSTLGNFQQTFVPHWQVMSLDTLPDGAVVAAGLFQNVSGSQLVNNIAVLNETTLEWHTIGEQASDAPLARYTILATVFSGMHQVVAFGLNEDFGEGVIASFLEREGWAFEQQALLEAGVVSSTDWSPVHGLVFGGTFSTDGVHVMRGLARWNNTARAMQQLGDGLIGAITDIAFLGDYLYMIGSMSRVLSSVDLVADVSPRRFGRYDFSTGQFDFPAFPEVGAFQAFDPFSCLHVVNQLVFVGGDFSMQMEDGTAGNVLAFDHVLSKWHAVGPVNVTWSPEARVRALADNGTHLFVGGSFELTTLDHGVFYNLACLDIASNNWVAFPRTCDRGTDCLLEQVNSIAITDDTQLVFIGGNFSFINSGFRKSVNNVAQLVGDSWVAMGTGLPGAVVTALAVVNSSVANTTVLAAGPALLQVFSGGEWAILDPTWSWKGFHARTLSIVYFQLGFSWPAYAIVLLIALSALVGVGFIVVLCMMRKQQRRTRDYSMLLDVTVGVGADGTSDDWLIDYESLTIYNPPIGKGAYSVVNRAVLKGTVVAVKTYVGSDYYGDLKADFHREISLLTRLRHPNIILFIGACRAPLCIVTELAERGCLYDVIHQTPQEMTWNRIRSIALDSCRGLAYLHNQVPPILHRDLKSANVLISETFVAKISDFGIARQLQIQTMTQRVGTTRWTAPEVLTNKADTSGVAYSLGSDVYSFGVIVWEMISLSLPWAEIPFDFQIEDHVIAGEHLPLADTTPDDYVRIMMSCWRFDANDRPEFTTLIQQLETIPLIEGSPERAPGAAGDVHRH